MTGHQKFNNLTKEFSSERKAKIATQTAKLQEEMALAELRKILPMQIDLSGQISNTHLPDSKALLPLFEAVVNSIHAIEDAGISNGSIEILIQREHGQLELIGEDGIAPIETFTVTDNGIGFDEKNYNSFLTAHSPWKIARGAKGIGRFSWLKAFNDVIITSIYEEFGNYYKRGFGFNIENGVYERFIENIGISNTERKTSVELAGFQNPYKIKCPQDAITIAKKILDHCISYFLLNTAPLIKVIDGKRSININDYFAVNLQPNSDQRQFELSGQIFYLRSLKFYSSETSDHKLCYCANHREVASENLDKYVVDLHKNRKIRDEDNKPFTYLAYLSGPYLDNRVNAERINFNIPEEPDDFAIVELRNISLEEIRNAALSLIEQELFPFLESIRNQKEQEIRSYISEEGLEYRPLLKYAPEKLRSIKPGLSSEKLEMELHKIMSSYELELKEAGKEILATPLEHFEKFPEYQKEYHRFLEQYNSLGVSKLAEYVVHRKIIISLFEKNLSIGADGRFSLEKDIHEIVFPMKTSSDETNVFERQNLWIIDERLSYHAYLSSDQSFNKLENLDSESKDRPDLLIFNNPIAFVADDEQPYSSVVVIEFKRPMRERYSAEENPIMQVGSYIEEIKSGRHRNKEGRLISLRDDTPFYAYIVCDLTEEIQRFSRLAGLIESPDRQGYFGFLQGIKTYMEVLSFSKLIKDAKQRNNILFKKLGV